MKMNPKLFRVRALLTVTGAALIYTAGMLDGAEKTLNHQSEQGKGEPQ